MTTPTRIRSRRRSAGGFALILVLFVLLTLALVTAGTLLGTSANLRATRNYRGAEQVHFVAESGISEALQKVNAIGVVNFQNDVVNQWTALFGGAAAQPFAPLAGFSFTVIPVASAGNPADVGQLIATATGVEGVRNVVVANVTRSNAPTTTPGALYLANDSPTDATFNGNAFTIDGNDHNPTGGPGPAPPVPGISTRNATNTQQAISSLSSNQAANVQGYGYQAGPPIVPSVLTSPAAPTIAEMNTMINDFLALPGVVTDTSGQITGNTTWGTPSAPQITYLNNATGVTIKGNGNASGAGILIVDGDLTIQGNFNFQGLILVRGKTNVTNDPSLTGVTGNATVYGSLWTQDVNLTVGGSAIVDYSSKALQYANAAGGGGALPAPLVVASLADCAAVPSGSGGCP